MIQRIVTLNKHNDSLASALYNWNVLGKFYGYHRAEWTQDHKNLAKRKLRRLPKGDVPAFRHDDFIFTAPDGSRIAQSDNDILVEEDPAIGKVTCRWRYQKTATPL
jgi:hypothetical protein